MGFLALVVIVLIFSTSTLFYQIGKNSQREYFKRELTNTAIAFCSFVLCYMGWFGFYVYEFFGEWCDDNCDHVLLSYWDQILTLSASCFLFSLVPILMLFFIHFQSYTSISRLFMGSNKLPKS